MVQRCAATAGGCRLRLDRMPMARACAESADSIIEQFAARTTRPGSRIGRPLLNGQPARQAADEPSTRRGLHRTSSGFGTRPGVGHPHMSLTSR